MLDFTLQRKNIFNHVNIAGSVRNVLNNRDARELSNASLIDDIPLPGRHFYLEVSTHF